MNDTTSTNEPADPVAMAQANIATFEAAWQDNQHDVRACANLAWALLVLASERIKPEIQAACSLGGCGGPPTISPEAAEQYARVLQLTDVVLSHMPESKETWLYRCESHLRLQQFEACREVCERMLSADPADMHAQRTLAYCHYYTGNSFESGKAYERAWELERENVELLDWARKSYSLADEEEQALRVAKLGVANFPRNAEFKRYLYERALRAERFAEALEIAEEQSRCDPKDYAPRVAAGHVLLKLERREEAQASFEEAIRLAPGQSGGYAGLLAAMGDPVQEAEVQEVFRRASTVENYVGDDFLAIVHWGAENGYAELALTLIERVSAGREVHSSQFDWCLADLLEKLGRHEEAEPLWGKQANLFAVRLEEKLAEIKEFAQWEFSKTLGPKAQSETLRFLCDLFQKGNRPDCLEQCLAVMEEIDPGRATRVRAKSKEFDTPTSA